MGDANETRSDYVNMAEGIGRVLNNKGLYIKLLKSFVGKSDFPNLLDAVEKKDFHAAAISAHTIKGVAANLSFPALRATMETLEAEFKGGKTEGFDLDGAKVCLEKTLAHINAIIDEG